MAIDEQWECWMNPLRDKNERLQVRKAFYTGGGRTADTTCEQGTACPESWKVEVMVTPHEKKTFKRNQE